MKVENGDAGREEASPSEGWRRALSPAVLTQRRALYQGFGDTLAVAFELAFTPVVLGLMGYGLDRWIGTLPIFTIVFVLMAIVGLSARMWYGYDARMKVHEANGPWARRVPPAAPPPGTLIAPGSVDAEAPPAPSDGSPAGDEKGRRIDV
ncbi:MAG TPA: AtpZ/AtpI family protein [Acidimicrobiia bacterium]|nr:AtpZ/AtpI family protein [Acidimicrobiia bacterium]